MADLLAPKPTGTPPSMTGGARDLLAKPQAPQEEGPAWYTPKGLLQAAVRAPLKVVETAYKGYQGAKALVTGKEEDYQRAMSTAPGNYGALGQVSALKPMFTGTGAVPQVSKAGVLDTIGTGLELGSWAPVGKAAVGTWQAGKALMGGLAKNTSLGVGRQVVKDFAKQAIKQTAKEGAVGGALGGGGAYLQDAEDPTVGGFLGHTALGAGVGAGAATLIGGGVIGAGATKQAFTRDALVQSVADNVYKIIRPTAKQLSLESKYSKDSSKFIAEFMLRNKIGAFNVDSAGRLDPSNVIERMADEESQFSDALSKYLSVHNATVSLDDYYKRALAAVDTDWNRAKGSDLYKMRGFIKREIDALKRTYARPGMGRDGGDVLVPISDFNRIKQGLWGKARGWATADDAIYNDVNFQLGHVAKEVVEQSIPEARIRQYNRYLGELATAKQLLEKRRGVGMPGGRVGRYVARVLGAAAGAKGGPVGSAVGMILADKLEQAIQSPTVSSALVRKLIGQIQKEAPEMLAEMQAKYGSLISFDIDKLSTAQLDDALRRARSPVGRAEIAEEVSALPRNADGTVTVYKVGQTSGGKTVIASTRREAERVSADRIAAGLDGQIDEMNVNPQQIEAKLPGGVGEVTVGPRPDMAGLPMPERLKSKAGSILDAFNASKDQVELGRLGQARFSIGSFLRDRLGRKMAKGAFRNENATRLDVSSVSETIPYITEAYHSQPPMHPYAHGNVAWIAEMPNGEKRAIITRKNAMGADELMETPLKVSDAWINSIKKNGPFDEAMARMQPTGKQLPVDIDPSGGEMVGSGAAKLVPKTEDVPVRQVKPVTGFTRGVYLPFIDKIASAGKTEMSKVELLQRLNSYQGPKGEKQMVKTVVEAMPDGKVAIQDVIEKLEEEQMIIPKRRTLVSSLEYLPATQEAPWAGEVGVDRRNTYSGATLLDNSRNPEYTDAHAAYFETIYEAPVKTTQKHHADIVGDRNFGHVRANYFKDQPIELQPLDLELNSLGDKITVNGKEVVFFDEFQTDIDQGDSNDMSNLLRGAVENLKAIGAHGTFEESFSKIKSEKVTQSVEQAIQAAKSSLERAYGFDAVRAFYREAVVKPETLVDITDEFKGVYSSGVSLSDVVGNPEYPFLRKPENLEKLLAAGWRAAREVVNSKRKDTLAVQGAYEPARALDYLRGAVSRDEDLNNQMALSDFLTKIAPPGKANIPDPTDPKKFFTVTNFRTLVNEITGASEKVERALDTPEVRELYREAFEIVSKGPINRVKDLERLNYLSGKIMEYELRDQFQMHAQAGKKYALLPTGATNQITESHVNDAEPFFIYTRRPVVPTEEPAVKLVKFEDMASANSQPSAMYKSGSRDVYMNLAGRLNKMANQADGGQDYARISSAPFKRLFDVLGGDEYTRALESTIDRINGHLTEGNITTASEIPAMFSSDGFWNTTPDSQREIVASVRSILESVLDDRNTEELNGILGEFSPDDFAKQAGESRVQFDAVDYFSEKHIEEAKKIQHTSRAFVRRLSDMQEDQITPTDKIELDRLYEMIVGEDATGSSIGRKLREIKNALNKTDRTFGFYNKYSNEIPKYAQRITGNKAELVKFGKDTMRLIKLPPPSPKGISQFAITPLIAFASLFGSRQGGQTEGSMAAENQAYATPLPQSLEAKPLDDQTKADLAALIYSEAGGKTYQEIEEQARTIYGTIMARAQQTGQAPRDVISTPGQYHGYGNQLYTEYQDGPKNLMNARKAQIIKKVVDELSGRPQPGADNSFFHEGGFGGPLKTHTMSPLTRNPSPTSTPYPYF